VAHACFDAFPIHTIDDHKKCFIVCGPGNNGGDALVAARHLKHYAYEPVILYPKETTNELYLGLLKQCQQLEIPIFKNIDDVLVEHPLKSFTFILDGIFGFSFSGKQGIREPYKKIIDKLKNQKDCPIISIDIPSGWDVDSEDVQQNLQIGLPCDILISLTAPKLCAQQFTGKHYLGGRFIPPSMEKEFALDLPKYKGTDIIVKIH